MLYKDVCDLFTEIREDFMGKKGVELSIGLALEGNMFYCRFGFMGTNITPLTLRLEHLEDEQDENKTTQSLKQFISMYYDSTQKELAKTEENIMDDLSGIGSTVSVDESPIEEVASKKTIP